MQKREHNPTCRLSGPLLRGTPQGAQQQATRQKQVMVGGQALLLLYWPSLPARRFGDTTPPHAWRNCKRACEYCRTPPATCCSADSSPLWLVTICESTASQMQCRRARALPSSPAHPVDHRDKRSNCAYSTR